MGARKIYQPRRANEICWETFLLYWWNVGRPKNVLINDKPIIKETKYFHSI